jgi:hypothetical protein
MNIIFIALIIIIFIIFIVNRPSTFSNTSRYAICLISVKPDPIWINFLETFVNYDIYIIIDDHTYEIPKNKSITFVKVPDSECTKHGYNNTVNINAYDYSAGKMGFKRFISCWDRALYTFRNTEYSNVWFIEEDAFFYSESTILNMDSKYPSNIDLLCKEISYVNKDGKSTDWHWKQINIAYPPPYYSCGSSQVVRLSNKLLGCIDNYAQKNKGLFLMEALFLSIAKKNNLSIQQPSELSELHYRKDFDSFSKEKVYHPIKDVSKHYSIRKEF